MKRWLLGTILVLLSACTSPGVSTPLPTPQPINLTYPLALQDWVNRLSTCANNDPLVALYINPSNIPITETLTSDIALEFAPDIKNMDSLVLSQVGQEQIVVIVNQGNTLSNLSADELSAIFSGQQKTWEKKSDQPIQVWVLPQGDPVRTIFDRVVMDTLPLTTDALLAPDPSAMLEAVSENPNAIGYLPGSVLNSTGTVDPGKITIVQLDSRLESALRQPVVAVTSGEPKGHLRSLLVCLESSAP